jgi:uncharacterized protein (DUF885 family)
LPGGRGSEVAWRRPWCCPAALALRHVGLRYKVITSPTGGSKRTANRAAEGHCLAAASARTIPVEPNSMARKTIKAIRERWQVDCGVVMKPCAALALAIFLSAMAAGESRSAPRETGSSTHQQLTQLAEDFIYTSARFAPLKATELGLPGFDGQLDLPSEASRKASVARLKAWRARLDSIVRSAGPGMSLVDADDAKLLRAQFDSELEELLQRQTDRKDYAGPSLGLTEAIFAQFLHLPIPGQEGATQADLEQAWEDIISRLEKGPAHIVAGERMVTRPGRLYGIVGAKQLDGIPDFFNGALTDAAKAQLAGNLPALQRFSSARDAVLATVSKTRAHLQLHAKSWPENFAIGKPAYDRMLREAKLLPFDAGDLERMARDELAHGWAEEAWLTAMVKQRKTSFGPDSGGGLAPGGPALVDYYRDRINDLKEFVDRNEVVTVPDWMGSMQIVETPAFLQPVSPGASMNPPRLFSKSTTGHYFITPPKSLKEAAERLDMNEDFDRDRILSTAAHEAIPGHFFQFSIARRHPDFVRRIQFDDAFSEGWAFYGEEMFVRLGLYGDDLDARLFTARWERVRGARVVVDVKLATGEWSVPQAIDFFEAQSGFTREASEAAVAGYALRPGYVVSYTVGRLQLESLLSEYMHRMGDRGSLRDFHDRLLSYGTVPFSIVGPELLQDLDKPASAVRAASNY